MNLNITHSLSKETRQLVQSLADALQHMSGKLDYITNHMATQADVDAAVTRLETAQAQEKAELKVVLDKQSAIIAELKNEIETGNNPALDGIVTRLDAATAEVQSFVTPDAA